MSTIGVRDLARHASSIISDLEQTREPALITRRGEHLVVYRPLTDAELRALHAAEAAGFLVERFVDRRDFEKAAATPQS